MNKKNGIFSLSVILALLFSLVAAIIVWLFAKYDMTSGDAALALVTSTLRFVP